MKVQSPGQRAMKKLQKHPGKLLWGQGMLDKMTEK